VGILTIGERRDRVEQLWNRGWSSPEIAKQLGVSRATVSMDIHYLRVTGVPLLPRRRPRGTDPVVARRRSQVVRLWEQGLMASEIAEQLGSTEGRIDTDVRWLKAEGRIGPHTDRTQHPALKARRREVAKLWRRHWAPERIAAELGIARSTVYEDLRRLRSEGRDLPHRNPALSEAQRR
jgi:DNA-binding CsgD family transcriptional regulator